MGYRSTVAYTIRFVVPDDEKTYGQVRDSFYTFIAEAKSKDTVAGAFLDEDLTVDEENLQIRFFADNVKWYESYPDVQCHECLMGLAREWADDNDYIGGAFARIGEETNDNVEEVWGQGEYEWVGVHRSIYTDWFTK
jgi:hypothetical protein